MSSFGPGGKQLKPKTPKTGADTLTLLAHYAVVWMKTISYLLHRFPQDIIKQTVWLTLRFSMSYGDVEELLAKRVIEVGSETFRR